MKINIPPAAAGDIVSIARDMGIGKVVLFGSRARGDARERSDIDLAVSGSPEKPLSAADAFLFRERLEEEARTLLMFDVVSLDECGAKLRAEIDSYGVVVYEKV